jgi:hypothetical protein
MVLRNRNLIVVALPIFCLATAGLPAADRVVKSIGNNCRNYIILLNGCICLILLSKFSAKVDKLGQSIEFLMVFQKLNGIGGWEYALFCR